MDLKQQNEHLKSEFYMEDLYMSKYEVIKNIMDSEELTEDEKMYYIEMFLKGWHTKEELKWIWE